jgi:DNA-binding NtrC family response regulator
VLVIEDEEFDVRRIRNTIETFGSEIVIAGVVSNGAAALELLRSAGHGCGVVIMDFQISGHIKGEQLIRAIKEIDASLQIIVVTKMTIHSADVQFARTLLDAGAFWYCTKYPGDMENVIYQPTDFVLAILNANSRGQMEKERQESARKMQKRVDLVLAERQFLGVSSAAERLRRQMEKCAETDANVLISGPSGSGKEIVATNIHYRSKRRFENFVPINCGSIPHELIESELFGYEKGAFTGAAARKRGLFEVAHGGTIFLDEISALPLAAQVKLLRVIEEGDIEKIGRTEPVSVDVRVIAATNEHLERKIAQQEFREDLFYRLNVVPITVPPLKERTEDIPVLVDHFLLLYSEEMGIVRPTLNREAYEALKRYEWPGNVRELRNVVQRLFFADQPHITADDIARLIGPSASDSLDPLSHLAELWRGKDFLPWREADRRFRAKYIALVREHSGSDAEAARKLGLAPPNFYRMCKELGLK